VLIRELRPHVHETDDVTVLRKALREAMVRSRNSTDARLLAQNRRAPLNLRGRGLSDRLDVNIRPTPSEVLGSL